MKKVFLTVLGTGNYRDCYYFSETQEYRSKFVQEALLKLIKEEKQINDIEVKILLTDAAKQKNYIATNADDKNLEDVLNKLNIKAQLIQIPEGKTEEELWQIFEKTIESIDNDTEIILDITHSLRNIPIQILVALNYLKLFKNISFSNIYYGAYEVGEFIDDPLHEGEKIKRAPICNLNTYIELLNWTNAINSFDKTGNAQEIIDLYFNMYNKKKKEICIKNTDNKKSQLISLDKEFKPLTKVIYALKDFTQCINTCRGDLLAQPNVYKFKNKSIGSAAYNLYISINNLTEYINMIYLIPLFSVVKEKVKPFISESNFEIGLATVKWCIDYNLCQQGFTALDETVKTFICENLNLTQKPNELKKIMKHREHIVSTALNCTSIENEGEWYFENDLNEKEKELIRQTIYTLKKNKEFVSLVDKINQKRNDINHFGFRGNQASDYDKLIKDLKKYYDTFIKIKDTIDLSCIHF